MCVPGTEAVVRARLADEGPPRHEGPRLTRRHAVAAATAGALASVATAAPARAKTAPKRVADLSHVLSETFPVFPGTPPTARRTLDTIPESGFYAQEWTLHEHVATHVDAPGHVIEGGRLAPQLAPSEIVAPLVVVDVSRRAASDPDTLVSLDDLRTFERRHGRIREGSVVCMHSGWDRRAGTTAGYLGADASGTLHFPGFGADAAGWLVRERRIGGIGVDTISLDHGPSQTFAAHFAVLGADRFGVENLRGLAGVPPKGATIVVGLVPWHRGSGGPCRALALW